MGNTSESSLQIWSYSVHPHTSGEYKEAAQRQPYQSGSSPHKWGIRRPQAGWNHYTRFIPTQVGNTSMRTGLTYRSRFIPTQVGNTRAKKPIPSRVPVHPHTSGEYYHLIRLGFGWLGSSPHKWGIHGICGPFNARCRFIPTQVGNTIVAIWCLLSFAVHPHTSGEYVFRVFA